jgi:hypothetical protein
MDGIGFALIGLVTALNILFIKKKFDKKRYEDAFFDMALLAGITIIFSGSFGALVVGMVASLVISISFYANPPNFIGPVVSAVKKELKENSASSTSFFPPSTKK